LFLDGFDDRDDELAVEESGIILIIFRDKDEV